MSIEPSPVVTREDQDRAAEIVERMAFDAREEWRDVYAKENECWKRLEKLRRTRDDVRMGDEITIAKVLREATDPTACGIAAVPFSTVDLPTLADGRLMAAAPDLLEALELMLNQYGCLCGHPHCNMCADSGIARAAIQKARGDQ